MEKINLKFYDREQELKELKRILNASSKGKFNFVVVSGRRGVGKTRLIYEFSKDVKERFVYFFVEKRDLSALIGDFVSRLEGVFSGKLVKPRDFDSFLTLLLELSKKDVLIVVFDEFQNFKYVDENIFSRFQEFVDYAKFRGEYKLLVVTIGSIVGLMREIFESRQSPLYGRKTAEIFVKPFEYWSVRRLLIEKGELGEEDMVNIFSLLGGMPKYYDYIDRLDLSFNLGDVLDLFTNKVYVLWKSPRDELIEEFKEAHTTYFTILEAIAKGKSKVNEIAGYTNIQEKSIYKYLYNLSDYFELVERRKPALAPRNYRGQLFTIKDPFYRFWFRYIFPNQDLIELEKGEELKKEIINDLPNHTSVIFEEIVRRTLLKISGETVKGIKVPNVAKVEAWWDRKGREIDIVGYRGKNVKFIGEVKWKNKPFDYRDLENFIKNVDALAQQYNIGDFMPIIVSKNGVTRSVEGYLEERNGLSLKLEDLAEIWDRFV